jgi:FtsH-binding integral membrane protein
MYEAKHQRPLSRAAFLRRVAGHMFAALALLILSLAMGMAGYQTFEHLRPTDAFLNTAMLLGGMGPVDLPRTEAGKIFAALYALYSGIVFLLLSTILVAPFLHRLLHRLHWQESL